MLSARFMHPAHTPIATNNATTAARPLSITFPLNIPLMLHRSPTIKETFTFLLAFGLRIA